MNLSIIIPIRPFGEGKTRLSGVLDAGARGALADRMFRHVLGVAAAAGKAVVTGKAMPPGYRSAQFVQEEGAGLNLALERAAGAVDQTMPVLVLFADLPLLSRDDLLAMTVQLGYADVVAAADRYGRGTNALLLAHPGLVPYAFGQDSLARHRALAQTRGLRFRVVRRHGLATDIDTPSDLSHLPAAWTRRGIAGWDQALCSDRSHTIGKRGSSIDSPVPSCG